MLIKLRKSLYVPLWIVPASIFYLISIFNGDFYSIGNFILAFLMSITILIGLSMFSSFFYEEIQDDVVSSTPPNIRVMRVQIKAHIIAIILLLMIYFALKPTI